MESGDAQPPSPLFSLRAFLKTSVAVLGLLPLLVSLSPPDRARPDPARGSGPASEGGLVLFRPASAQDLAAVLDRVWAEVGDGGVPNVAPATLPPGLDRFPVSRRKQVFVRAVVPHVVAANERIRAQRDSLEAIARNLERGGRTSEVDLLFLLDLARRYRVKVDPAGVRADPRAVLDALLKRVDVVPVPLAVAQAALESAWGTSRFALEGNSLFGQWVFRGGAGMAPRDRPAGARYAVAAFPGLAEAVDGYLRNLNTLWAYEEFRRLRARARAEGRRPDPRELAWGLLPYSVRREAYVQEVLDVMRQNRLGRYQGVRLVRLAPDRIEAALGGIRLASGREAAAPDA